MSIKFSNIINSHERGDGRNFIVHSLNMHEIVADTSPIEVLDNFYVNGKPFPPHPHAGFAANTYVFRDSKTGLRSRDSLGGDIIVGPGGIVWTHSGKGVMHQEMPSEANSELHGIQFFVNLSAKNKLSDAMVLSIDGGSVPEWKNDAGDIVYVASGSYEGLTSPLSLPEPFTLLDVILSNEIGFNLSSGHNAMIYVIGGEISVQCGELKQELKNEQAMVFSGNGHVSFKTKNGAHFVILSGAELHEPVVTNGPFIMNTQNQIAEAAMRYRNGKMGRLDPVK